MYLLSPVVDQLFLERLAKVEVECSSGLVVRVIRSKTAVLNFSTHWAHVVCRDGDGGPTGMHQLMIRELVLFRFNYFQLLVSHTSIVSIVPRQPGTATSPTHREGINTENW